MKKLFTLAAAVLASFTLWAADETVFLWQYDGSSTYGDGANNGVFEVSPAASTGSIVFVTYEKKKTSADGTSAYDDAVTDADLKPEITKVCKLGNNGAHMRISLTSGNFLAGDIVYICGYKDFIVSTSADPTSTSKITSESGGATIIAASLATGSEKGKCNVGSVTLPEDFAETNEIYISRANGASAGIAAIKVVRPQTCTDPKASLTLAYTVGFVGDPSKITFSSENTNEVTYTVTLDGVTAVAGTDYRINEYGVFFGNKAGEFVITASQPADEAGHCAVEESATYTVSVAAPVTKFTIDAPATAHIGEEVTITLKDFDATPTEIRWYTTNGDLVEIAEAANKTSYSFTPSAEGIYQFVISAWNQFNTIGDDEAFSAHAITVAVGTDATLSDLKVNGTTVAEFAADKLEYNLGDFGVYEALNVEAVATDAPYATVEIVDDKAGKVTVTVTAEDKETTTEYVLNYNRAAKTELVAIDGDTEWDWAEAGAKVAENTGLPARDEWFNFADLLTTPGENFKAASLEGMLQFANRDNNSYAQGHKLRFVTTVAGKVTVVFSNTGKKDVIRDLFINGVDTEVGSKSTDKVTAENVAVEAGEVLIEGKEMLDPIVDNMLRFYKVTFVADKGDETAIDNTDATVKATKRVINGVLFIEKNGVLYNAQGAVVK